MNTQKKEILEVVDSIEKATELFYQQKNKKGYIKFEETLNLLSSILNSVINEKHIDLMVVIDELNTKLAEAMEALEEGDTILLADILKYEICPILMILYQNSK